jgi:hypothetical protein
MASKLDRKFTRLHIAAATLALIFGSPPISPALGEPTYAQNPLADFPLVVVCKTRDTYHIFQLSRVTKDGTATYVASERIAGTITLNGRAKAVGNKLGGDCLGKTLEELRASGQALDIRR